MKQNFTQKINNIEGNIKTCHITYNVLCDFNLKDYNITLNFLLKRKFYVDPSLWFVM